MKFASKLTLLAGAVLGMITTVASAEPIIASVSIGGTTPSVTTAATGPGGGYAYSYSTLSVGGAYISNTNVIPNSGGVTAANSTVAPFFTNFNPGTFSTISLPIQGQSGTVPGSTATTGGSLLFSTSQTINANAAAGGANTTATLQFYITSYTVVDNRATTSAGTTGALTLMGNGYYVETATGHTYTNTAATFSLNLTGNGTFSFSANAVTTAATPEPSSLVLLGTGLMGAAGVAFRRRRTLA